MRLHRMTSLVLCGFLLGGCASRPEVEMWFPHPLDKDVSFADIRVEDDSMAIIDTDSPYYDRLDSVIASSDLTHLAILSVHGQDGAEPNRKLAEDFDYSFKIACIRRGITVIMPDDIMHAASWSEVGTFGGKGQSRSSRDYSSEGAQKRLSYDVKWMQNLSYEVNSSLFALASIDSQGQCELNVFYSYHQACLTTAFWKGIRVNDRVAKNPCLTLTMKSRKTPQQSAALLAGYLKAYLHAANSLPKQ